MATPRYQVISIKHVVAMALWRAVLSDFAKQELEALDILLTPYKDDDEKVKVNGKETTLFEKEKTENEERFDKIEKIPQSEWGRKKKPTKSHEYARILLRLARRQGLLDHVPRKILG